MKTIKVKNLYTDGQVLQNKIITINNGFIEKIEDNNLETNYDFVNISPALVDLHINGGEQFHFTSKPDFETIIDIEKSNFINGVGYSLPTLITSSFENIHTGIETIKRYCEEQPYSGILGLHLEGPFLSEKRRGAHLTKYLCNPTEQLLNELIETGNETIKIITIAPELFTQTQLKLLIDSKMMVSVGHSDANFDQSIEAFGLKINLVTHLFNAMSGLGHRQPGLVGAALFSSDVYTPVILDNIHIKKEVAILAYKLKKDKLFLISDALFLNHKKKEFLWEEFDIEVVNNQFYNKDGNLAGASISLADAVKNAYDWFQIPVEEALNMATSIPAKLINTNRKIGSIKPGYEAKFCTFDNDLSNFKGII